jgi:hypothetical protein
MVGPESDVMHNVPISAKWGAMSWESVCWLDDLQSSDIYHPKISRFIVSQHFQLEIFWLVEATCANLYKVAKFMPGHWRGKVWNNNKSQLLAPVVVVNMNFVCASQLHMYLWLVTVILFLVKSHFYSSGVYTRHERAIVHATKHKFLEILLVFYVWWADNICLHCLSCLFNFSCQLMRGDKAK